jgi:TonB family protein
MKLHKIIVIAAVLCVLPLKFASAEDPNLAFEATTTAYKPPVLVKSAVPKPVWYAPGRTIEGYVTLEIKVGEDGNIKAVRVLYRTSVLAVKSAVRALDQWKFEPATLNGKPVTSWVAYSLPFGNNLQIFVNDNYPHRVLDPESKRQFTIK